MALLPVSISIGILCGLWFQITVWNPWLIAWVDTRRGPVFTMRAGNKEALPKSIAANFAG